MPIVGNIYSLDEERRMMRECLETIRQRIIANIDSKGLKASGRSQESLEIVDNVTSISLVGRDYFQGLEIGRPGVMQMQGARVPHDFDLIIRQWIIDKGIKVRQIPYKTDRRHIYSVEERSLNMAVSAICHRIYERGTLLYNKGGDRTVYTPVIEEEVDNLVQKLDVAVSNLIVNNYSSATGRKI